MNGGSDTETEGSDTEYPAVAKRSKKVDVPADIFMAEESEDDLENEPEDNPSDCDHEEEPDAVANEVIEIKDIPIPRSVNLERDHVGNRSASVFWSFFDITPLMTTYVDRNGEEKINHLLKCNIGKCKYSTTDHKRNTSNSNMRKHLLTMSQEGRS
jgi:hypothetical protein